MVATGEFTAEFEKMKDYDELFQDSVFNSSVTPGIDFPETGHYVVEYCILADAYSIHWVFGVLLRCSRVVTQVDSHIASCLYILSQYYHFACVRARSGSARPSPAVVDFQGWMYQPIPLCTVKEFVTWFSSHIVHCHGHTSIIFRCWEALSDDASIPPPAGLSQEGLDNEVV